MADGCHDLSSLVGLSEAISVARRITNASKTYLRREFDVVFVVGQIDDGAVATDIEDDIVVLGAHFGELLGAGQFGLDGLVNQELDALVVLE